MATMNALQSHDCDLLRNACCLIGVDEAGRGCLAGPVTAGACILKAAFFESAVAIEQTLLMNDSKQLKAEAREAQLTIIEELQSQSLLDFAVAEGSVPEIEELNILGATRLAMQRAVEILESRMQGDCQLPCIEESGPLFDLHSSRVAIIVDGRPLKPFPYAHRGIVKGDGRSLSIAIASIAAKVNRDRRMSELDDLYPGYGFSKHKGYGTKLHRTALHRLGSSDCHRSLFLRKIL